MKTINRDESTKAIVDELIFLLNRGNAHAGFDDAVNGLQEAVLGKKPQGMPYSIWQLVEHIRITQWDILEFSRDSQHQSPEWPAGYWPKEAAPKSMAAFRESVQQIEQDKKAFIALLKDPTNDIYEPFPHGDGQTLLREALVIADHTAYHTGEIIVLRRLLGAWR